MEHNKIEDTSKEVDTLTLKDTIEVIDQGKVSDRVVVKDTGNRTTFETGSEKDIALGRGRFELIPLIALANIYLYDDKEKNKPEAFFVANISRAMTEPRLDDKLERLYGAFTTFTKYFLNKEISEIVPDIAKLYEAGAIKYAERDWEKGRPMEVFINSILRHFYQFINGDSDEDHGTAVLWNLLSLIDTLRRLPHLAYTHEEVLVSSR